MQRPFDRKSLDTLLVSLFPNTPSFKPGTTVDARAFKDGVHAVLSNAWLAGLSALEDRSARIMDLETRVRRDGGKLAAIVRSPDGTERFVPFSEFVEALVSHSVSPMLPSVYC